MDNFEQLAERAEALRGAITSEEATKTSLIMPFFQMLGYDIFNPLEFIPEYTSDFGTKKKRKVDYAIMVNGKPLIFVECKSCNEKLDKYSAQLEQYFATTIEAKIAILTNGIIYNFYTDLDNSNIMDKRPFLSVDLLNMRKGDITELNKFKKEELNIDNIINAAENLKYVGLIKDWFTKEIEKPSAEFIRMAINNIYSGVKNQKVVDQFVPIVKKAISQYITDEFNQKIQEVLNEPPKPENPNDIDTIEENENDEKEKRSEIVTTIEELEAYGVIKSILRKTVDSSRITYRDTASYFGILLDNNKLKWICRVHLGGNKKYIIISDNEKQGIRYDIECIDDIYKYANIIIESCNKYL